MTASGPATSAACGGLRTLAGVRGFLLEHVVAAVPADLAGEVRAAVKLLRTVELEFDSLHVLLRTDTTELVSLCAVASRRRPGLGIDFEIDELRRTSENADATVGELARRHDAARELSARVIEALQLHDDPTAAALLDQFYSVLGRHAEKRLGWQSVFPESPNPVASEGRKQ